MQMSHSSLLKKRPKTTYAKAGNMWAIGLFDG